MIKSTNIKPENQNAKPFWVFKIRWIVFASVVMFPMLLWTTYNIAKQNYLESLAEDSFHALELHAVNLRGQLEKFQAMPKLLGTNGDVIGSLQYPDNKQRNLNVNLLLERMNRITAAADTYLMDTTGVTIAASSWNTQRSFVGRNFNFRPYFQDAVQGKLGRYFALGTTSNVKGYYFASPVLQGQNIIGVSVVKVNLDAIEEDWSQQVGPSFAVSDDNGVLFIANRPEWRYKTLTRLPDNLIQEISDSRKYLGHKLESAELRIVEDFSDDVKIVEINVQIPDREAGEIYPKKFMMQSLHMPEAGWTLHIFDDYQIIRDQLLIALIVVSLALASGTLGLITLIQRANTKRQSMMYEEQAKLALQKSAANLEKRVLERTKDLKETNLKLEDEIQTRRKAEEHLRISQANLLQAEKLAALGKMSAGISHELNQPLSAIRSYADNARKFLERANPDKAEDNLAIISQLTQRMGNIIRHLKMFSRKPADKIDVISLNRILDEAIRVIIPRVEENNIKLDIDWGSENYKILGSSDRLEQVFINLFSNALDSMGKHTRQQHILAIQITGKTDTIEIIVTDTGSGMADSDIEQVFDPFFTTKEIGEGLGLGLSISYSILQDCGGSLRARNIEDGGAEFEVTLRRALEEGNSYNVA